APFTPYEFYQYFLDQRRTLEVALLPVPVKVPEKSPTLEGKEEQQRQAELEALFARYKEREPNPSQPEPGFKEPRRVKVQWVSVRGDSPTAHKAAEQALPVIIAAQEALTPTPFLLNGQDAIGAVALNAVGFAKEGYLTPFNSLALPQYEE